MKIAEIAGLLRRVPPGEVAVAVAFLSGELRQRQIGVGYAALTNLLRASQSARPPAQGAARARPPKTRPLSRC